MPKIPPYDTGKIKIGCRYDPPLRNQYNPDQDWVQEVLLGIQKDWFDQIENLIEYAIYIVLIYCVLSLLGRP